MFGKERKQINCGVESTVARIEAHLLRLKRLEAETERSIVRREQLIEIIEANLEDARQHLRRIYFK